MTATLRRALYACILAACLGCPRAESRAAAAPADELKELRGRIESLKKQLADAWHKRLWENIPYIPIGQYQQPFVWRKETSGWLKVNTVVYWNVEKN